MLTSIMLNYLLHNVISLCHAWTLKSKTILLWTLSRTAVIDVPNCHC